jgi:hypothetical protein
LHLLLLQKHQHLTQREERDKQHQWLIQTRKQLWMKKKEPNGKKFVMGLEFSLKENWKMDKL